MKSKETDLVRACLAFLEVRGIYAWRNNSGAVKTDNRFIRYGKVGSCDILGILDDGRFLGIECKVGKRKTTMPQEEFMYAICSRGGVAFVARTIDDVADAINAATKGTP